MKVLLILHARVEVELIKSEYKRKEFLKSVVMEKKYEIDSKRFFYTSYKSMLGFAKVFIRVNYRLWHKFSSIFDSNWHCGMALSEHSRKFLKNFIEKLTFLYLRKFNLMQKSWLRLENLENKYISKDAELYYNIKLEINTWIQNMVVMWWFRKSKRIKSKSREESANLISLVSFTESKTATSREVIPTSAVNCSDCMESSGCVAGTGF